MADNLKDLRERLDRSELALEWLHTNITRYFNSVPVGDMDECILHAERALQPYIVEQIEKERNRAVELQENDK